MRLTIAVVAGLSIAIAFFLVAARKQEGTAMPKKTKEKDRAAALREERLPAPFSALTANATPKTPPGEADWLASHHEPGESVAEFRTSFRSVHGKTIYLLPVGALDAQHAAIVDELEPLLRAWYQLEVKRLPPLPEKVARVGERQREWGPQLLTRTILDAARERRPEDAAAVMAVTAIDLYPDPSWNFVFGEASYEERVGVMSLARDGDPEKEHSVVLERALATAAHEIGHMARLPHCIAWECAMNGSNHREEADSRPLEPCPACLAKLAIATGFDPLKRWRDVEAAYANAELFRGVDEVHRALAALDAGTR